MNIEKTKEAILRAAHEKVREQNYPNDFTVGDVIIFGQGYKMIRRHCGADIVVISHGSPNNSTYSRTWNEQTHPSL